MKFQKMSDQISICSRLDCIFKNTKNINKCCFYLFILFYYLNHNFI